MARGPIVYPMGGTIDDSYDDHMSIAPPFIGNAAALDPIVERLGAAVDAAMASA